MTSQSSSPISTRSWARRNTRAAAMWNPAARGGEIMADALSIRHSAQIQSCTLVQHLRNAPSLTPAPGHAVAISPGAGQPKHWKYSSSSIPHSSAVFFPARSSESNPFPVASLEIPPHRALRCSIPEAASQSFPHRYQPGQPVIP